MQGEQGMWCSGGTLPLPPRLSRSALSPGYAPRPCLCHRRCLCRRGGRARRPLTPLPLPPDKAGDGPCGADPATASLSGSAGGHPAPPFPGVSGPRRAPGGLRRGGDGTRRGAAALSPGRRDAECPPLQRGAGCNGAAFLGLTCLGGEGG